MQSGRIVKKIKIDKKEIVFRYPKIEDVENLLKFTNFLIEEKAFISLQKKVSKKKELYWLFEKIKRIEEKRSIILVAEEKGKIKGIAEIEKFGKSAPATHIGELEMMLAKDIRGEGIGERFFTAIIKEAKKRLKIKIIFIDIAKPNKKALSFFEWLGFKTVGKIKRGFKYYGRYLDDIIMVKYL